MAKEKLFFVGIKGLIENEKGEILLLLADVSTHRKNIEPYWDIPGGRIQQGNDAMQTLQREIVEETGIKTISETEFMTAVISKHEIPLDDDSWAGLVLLVYKVTVPAGSEVVISDEHSEYEWVSRSEAKERLSHKYPAEFTDLL